MHSCGHCNNLQVLEMYCNENKWNTGTGHNDRTDRWVQETRKTTLKMDGQHKRKHRLWFGKIKRDSKR